MKDSADRSGKQRTTVEMTRRGFLLAIVAWVSVGLASPLAVDDLVQSGTTASSFPATVQNPDSNLPK